VHWGGILFAALVIVLAIPFALSHFRGSESPLRTDGAKTLLAVVIIAALSLGFVNVIRALGSFENQTAYWALNIALSALFWLVLLRLCWRERRQRPR
jgi:VIT1/CCC1 family predicted Fe2+/Mn2+ transporter